MISLMLALLAPLASFADAPLKIISFRADWCPACHVFEPALSRALENYSRAQVELVTLDLTHLKSDPDSRDALIAATHTRLRIHNAGYLWDWYEGRTGMAVLIATGTGKPVACIDSRHSARDMTDTIELSLIEARSANAGEDGLSATACPDPLR